VNSLAKTSLIFAVGTLMLALQQPLRGAGIPDWIVAILFCLVFATIVQILLAAESVSPINFSPATSTDFSWLKVNRLDDYTQELESIGLIEFSDYRTPNFIFFRIFSNRDRDCLVVVHQKMGQAMRCTVYSFFTDNWSLASFLFQRDKPIDILNEIAYRHARVLWINQSEDLNLAEIFKFHRQRGDRLARDLNISVKQEIGADTYFDYEQMLVEIYKQNLRQKWLIITLIEACFRYLNPQSEWMGEYQDRLDILRKSAF
jgi:hypothetical protein